MGYLALYRKYRPSKFSEVTGQKYIIDILKNAVKTQNISHAYLFSGPRGTGKTSVAKIFARSVNCLNPKDGESCGKCEMCKAIKDNDIDIIEIDAASNNGVDEIREIRSNVKLMPTVGKYKVYIIDEVHMLSAGAFNALLKTLEEPPQHIIFILATTEIQKIPLTIISRCQKFDFKKISDKDISKKLKEILKLEEKSLSDDVISLIAKISDGGLRDAINLLDQIVTSSSNDITVDDIYNLNGDISEIELEQLFDYLINGDIAGILKTIDDFYDRGKNIYSIIDRLILMTRNININNNVNNYFNSEIQQKYEKYFNLSNDVTNYISSKLINLSNEIRKSEEQKLLLEISLLEIIENLHKKVEQKEIKNVNDTEIKCEEKEIKIEENDEKIISREIISIRINNVLAKANKEILKKAKEKLMDISEYISNAKYNKLVNIVNEMELVVASDDHLLFCSDNEGKLNLFLINLEKIEKFMSEILESKYKVAAVTDEEWNKIKKEYIKNIQNGIKYILQEEPKIKKAKNSKAKNEIVQEIFGEEKIDIK